MASIPIPAPETKPACPDAVLLLIAWTLLQAQMATRWPLPREG
jgi:hypothetical protein